MPSQTRQRWMCAILALLAAFLGIPEFGSAADPPDAKPNFVFIIADDLGWNDVGYHGSEINTPRLDRLAAGGVRLDQHYVTPVCWTTRECLLLGRGTKVLSAVEAGDNRAKLPNHQIPTASPPPCDRSATPPTSAENGTSIRWTLNADR